MLRKYLLPAIALIGACIALVVVFWTQSKPPVAPILYPPPKSPYQASIAASGVIEASSENISIGSPFSEIVTNIYVTEGDRVKAGDLLFVLDLRLFEAQKASAVAELEAALVNYEDQKTQFSFYERVVDKRAVSEQDYQRAKYALWEAQEQVRVAEAKILEIEANIQRSTIRSPIDAEILQVNVHVGEIAPVVPFVSTQATLILLGSVQPLQVRIDIDEEDAWRFQKGSKATAFVRGNSAIHFPLQFLRIEPFMIPKYNYTGDTSERTDTRVLQVLYRFEKADLPVYTGQILDIFIEATPESS